MPTICPRCRKWIDNYNSCGYDARFDTHYSSLSKEDEELFKDLLNRRYGTENVITQRLIKMWNKTWKCAYDVNGWQESA